MDTIEEEYDLESNRTVNNQINDTNQITNKLNISLSKNKRCIVIVKKSFNNSSKTLISLVEEEKEDSPEKHFDNILSEKDLLNKYVIITKKDNPDEFMSYFDNLLLDFNVILVLFEAFMAEKHEKLIKYIKDRDCKIKILIQIDCEKVNEDYIKYYKTLNIEEVITNTINEKLVHVEISGM